jgi:hypothetical protein
MKHILQHQPNAGNAAPYRNDEQGRVFGTRIYWEVELPVPTDNRTSPPEAYLVFYVIPQGNISIVLANPPKGVSELIEVIRKEKEFVAAFRKEWPLFDSLYCDDKRVMTEFTRRPVLFSLQDPDDAIEKWMVGRQVTVPTRTDPTPGDIELAAMDSLLVPTLQLLTEAEKAVENVAKGLVAGTYSFPKTKFEKVLKVVSTIAEVVSLAGDLSKPPGEYNEAAKTLYGLLYQAVGYAQEKRAKR